MARTARVDFGLLCPQLPHQGFVTGALLQNHSRLGLGRGPGRLGRRLQLGNPPHPSRSNYPQAEGYGRPVQQPRALGPHRAHRTMRELAWLRSRAKPVGIRTAAAEQATGRDQSPWPLSVGPGRTGYPYPAKSADRRPRATRSSTRSTCMPKQRDVAVDRAQTRAPTDQAPRRPGIHPRKSTSPARLRGSVWA